MATPLLLTTLRDVRKRNALTLAKAAALTGLNLSQISQIENGNVDPRLSSVSALAGMLDLVLVAVPRSAAVQIQALVASGGLITAPSANVDPPAVIDRLRVPNPTSAPGRGAANRRSAA